MSTKVKRHFFKLGLILFTLISSEFICRIIYPTAKNISFAQLNADLKNSHAFNNFTNSIQNDDQLFWTFKPSIKLSDPTKKSKYRGLISNDQRLRETSTLSLNKKSNERRIIFIGDSCTFGYGHLEDKTYIHLFENRINNSQSQLIYNAINAGVPGYSLYQGKEYFKRDLLKYQPEALVVCFGWNDQNLWSPLNDEQRASLIIKQNPPGLLRHSRICQFFWRSTHENSAEKQARVSPEKYYSYLEELYQLCQKENVKMALTIWPFKYNLDSNKDPKTRGDWQIVQYAFAEKHPDCLLIDLVPIFQQIKDHSVEELFLDEGHVTELANRYISEELMTKMTNWVK